MSIDSCLSQAVPCQYDLVSSRHRRRRDRLGEICRRTRGGLSVPNHRTRYQLHFIPQNVDLVLTYTVQHARRISYAHRTFEDLTNLRRCLKLQNLVINSLLDVSFTVLRSLR